MKIRSARNRLLALSVIFFTPSLVHAHTGIGHTAGFLHGFAHPFAGLDHILAMAAVGIWAAQIGGRAIWAIPTTFVSVMVIGGFLGITGVAVPFVDQGIVMSVLILGVLIAAAAPLPLPASAAIAGLFAVFHGHAHGAEIPAAVSALAYGSGFLLSTLTLHLIGMGIGLLRQRAGRLQVVRLAGVAIALAGLYIFLQR